MKTIQIYKTNIGIFVKNVNSSYYNNKTMEGRINGIENLSLMNEYAFIPDAETVVSYETLRSSKMTIVGHELINKELASASIPMSFSAEAVNRYYSDQTDQYEWEFNNSIRPLYTEVYETAPEYWEAEDFTVVVLREFEIEAYNKPIETKVSITGGYSGNEKKSVDLSSIVSYDEIEKLVTPEFLMHERPCRLSSDQVYSIVRQYIKENIDGKCARITSDYNFCFTVKQVVNIKPYVHVTETKKNNGRSYATPKIKRQTVTTELIDLFEMTNSTERYKGYTVIAAWEANSLREMKDQLESYLTTLMEFINTAVDECQHCSGTGHIVRKKPTNERDL